MAHHDASTYDPRPQVRRFKEAQAKHGPGSSSHTNPHGKGLEHEHGAVTRTEVERAEDGKHHVKAHHADGHVQHHGPYNDHEEAHEHAKALMSGAGDSYAHEQHGNEHEAAEETAAEATPISGLEDQDVEAAGGEKECPNCGSKMADGKCPNCGYEEADEDEED